MLACPTDYQVSTSYLANTIVHNVYTQNGVGFRKFTIVEFVIRLECIYFVKIST